MGSEVCCISIRPLAINELEKIRKLDYIDDSALTESILSAIEKKICKMKKADDSMYKWYTYWIIINEENRGIGFVGAKGIPDENGEIEIGYSIAAEYRNCGFMTEAVRKFIAWTFSFEICSRVTARVLEENMPSLKVLLKCGFIETGRVKDGYRKLILDKFTYNEN